MDGEKNVTTRSKRHSWMAFTTLYVAVLLIPVLLYVFVYQGSRIDQVTMRNFRSLDAAAERIKEAMKTMRKVAKNYSFGIDKDLLDDIVYASSVEERKSEGKSHQIIRSKEAARILSDIIREQVATRGIEANMRSVLVNQACDGVSEKKKCKSLEAARRTCPASLWHCRHARPCSSGMRVSAGHIVSEDCRLLRERNRSLYKLLQDRDKISKREDISGGSDLLSILDRFGIEVSVETSDALDHPTRHLSMFFDSYFVASGPENVIFSAGSGNPGAPMPHHESSPFVSVARISDILAAEYGMDELTFPLTQSNDQRSRHDEPLTGHSTVRTIDVNDIALSVFVHPFSVDTSISEGEENVSTWYVIGVVPRMSLAREAIRIRLGRAADATLAIVLLLAFLPILRFWSASGRSLLSRFGIYGIGASSVGVAALATTLGWSVVGKNADSNSLDRELKMMGNEVLSRFRSDAERTLSVVEEDINMLVECGYARNSEDARVVDANGCPTMEKNELRKALLCESRKDGDERAMVSSAFLLDEEGVMAACTQYLKRQSQELDLEFRPYFKEPHVLQLVEPSNNGYSWIRGPAVFQTIDSIVQGKKEVVVSFAINGKDGCTQLPPCDIGTKGVVGAAVVHVPSIDDVVLESPFYYAIIDELGETLLHSDDDRERVSNFLEDTSNDVGVRLAIESAKPRTIDTYYDGRPIRAHFMPLDIENYEFLPRHGKGGKSWILVVYAKYRTVDSLSLLTVSLSVVFWSGTTTLIFLAIAGLALLRRISGRDSILPAAIAMMGSGNTVVVALTLIAAGLAWSCLWPSSAWVVAVLLPLFITLFIYSLAWRWAHPCRGMSKGDSEGDLISKATLAFATVLICFSVVPMVAWQSYFRGELKVGLDKYLDEKRTMQIERLEGAYRAYVNSLAEPRSTSESRFIVDHVVSLPGREATRLGTRDAGDGSKGHDLVWPFNWLEPLVAHSELTKAMMREKGLARTGAAQLERDLDIGTELLVSVMLVGGALLLFLSYSSVRAKLGHARRIVLLPRCKVDGSNLTEGGQSRRIKMILLRRSDGEMDRFLDALRARYMVHVASWSDYAKVWTWSDEGRRDDSQEEKPRMYVVRDLRAAVGRERGVELARELERKERDDVILCADVVPSYRIGPGMLDDSGDEAPMFGNEWMELIGGFDIRVLSDVGGDGRCPEDGKDCASKKGKERYLAKRAIDLEVRAHKDFKSFGATVKSSIDAGDIESGNSGKLRDMALGKFRAGALLRFKAIWSACSNDERLQIVALARGGAPNIRQHAAISSLANRGIITTHDPIELTSKAFRDFVNRDLAHDSLEEWRRRGHRDWWRVTWLPLVILAGLGLMFFLNSNPEAIGTLGAIFAALIAFVPVVTSLLRVGQSGLPIGGSGVVE